MASPAVGGSGGESRERVLVAVNPSFAPSWRRLFWPALRAGAFAWTFVCRRFRSRAGQGTGVTGGGAGTLEGGGCRANFPGVLPSKQFKNINHIGSGWLLKRCSHAAGTVAGERAARPGQEGRQLGKHGCGWRRGLAASRLASLAAFQVGAASSESKDEALGGVNECIAHAVCWSLHAPPWSPTPLWHGPEMMPWWAAGQLPTGSES